MKRNFDVTIQVTQTFVVPVTARDEDDAGEKAIERFSDGSNYSDLYLQNETDPEVTETSPA